MRIAGFRAVDGPNTNIYRPVLVMTLDLEELAGRESCEIAGFADRLLALLPGLEEHHCAKGEPGGFVERLREGTYFGHVVEHVAIELAQGTNIAGDYGKTVYVGRPGLYDVKVEYRAERAARLLLETAVDLVTALVAGRDSFPFDVRVREAVAMARAFELSNEFRSIVTAAEHRGIPWRRRGDASIQLGYGKHQRLIEVMSGSDPGLVAALFGEIADGRIPIVGVAGSAGTGAVARAVARTLESAWRVVAIATDAEEAREALARPDVEAAVVESSLEGIDRLGLGYDWCDAAILTGVREDDTWPEWVETRDDALHVYSLVAERVHEGGTVVLDAQDELLAALPAHRRMQSVTRRVVLVAERPELPALAAHLDRGGRGLFLRDGWVVEAGDGNERRVAGAHALASLAGELRASHALAAVAAALALGALRSEGP